MPGRTQKSDRPPLTRDRVIEAALRLMDEEGLEAISMRRVARDVGVEAMSLYHHVADKEDLLAGVVERVMAEFVVPATPDAGWDRYGREVARAWRRLLTAHPHVMPLLAHSDQKVVRPHSLRPMEEALRVLREAGLSERDAVQGFHVMGGYIMGFVLLEAGGMFGRSDDHGGAAHPAPAWSAVVSAETYPYIAASLPHLDACDLDEQFEFGLDLMFEGLRARAGRSPSPVGETA